MKVAICTPYYGGVTAQYAQSLAQMIIHTMQSTISYKGVVTVPQLEVFTTTSSVLPWARNFLVEDAVGWDADFLLWIDADHSFPRESLLRLLSLNRPVVGANYPRRGEPVWPTAVGLDGSRVVTTEELATKGEVVEVASLGLGYCLVSRTVLDALRAEQPDGERLPLFALEMFSGGLEIAGEDVFFFRRVRKAGYAVHLDHALSWYVGHMHSRALTHADVDTSGASEWPR